MPNTKKKNNVKLRQRPIDFILVVTVLLMLSLGIIMVLSASSPSALAESGDSYAYVKTQSRSCCLTVWFLCTLFQK